jgi:hypothetical protein
MSANMIDAAQCRRGKEGIAVAIGIVKWFSSENGYGFISQGAAPMYSCSKVQSRAEGYKSLGC